LIDKFKQDRKVVKLYKGSHLSDQPHQVVFDFLNYFSKTKRGVISFMKENGLSASSRCNIEEVIDSLYDRHAKAGETRTEFEKYIDTRQHNLGLYRGGSTGFSDESKALVASYFKNYNFDLDESDINIFSGGIKGAFICFCAAIFAHHDFDEISMNGGVFLMPVGYYQSLRNIPSLFKCQINVADIYSHGVVKAWIESTSNIKRRAIYIPTVNNSNGVIINKTQIEKIISLVIQENLAGRELYVFWDDVYRGSNLTNVFEDNSIPFNIEVNGNTYNICDYAVVATSSSKTYALPTARVSFTGTKNKALFKAMEHYQILLSYGRISQIDELTALVAILCTPQKWIDEYNAIYRKNLRYLDSRVTELNKKNFGDKKIISINRPDGGWYFILLIDKSIVDSKIDSSLGFLSIMLSYSNEQNSGIACLPGELFGYINGNKFAFRGTLAIAEKDMQRLITYLDDMLKILTSEESAILIEQKVKELGEMLDIGKLMENTRY